MDWNEIILVADTFGVFFCDDDQAGVVLNSILSQYYGD